MNIPVTNTGITLFSPELLVLAVLVLGLFLMIQKQNKRLADYERRLRLMKSDMQALLLCSRGVGDKLNYQQREFRNLIDRQDRLELGDKVEPSYRQAAALFDRGASEDEMIDACDLTQAEVDLIAQLRQTRHNTQKKLQDIELVA